MSDTFSFHIEKNIPGALGRAGVLHTPHGTIETPAFVTVGTKGTVKAMTSEQVVETGAQVVLANTYHLYLEPGDEIVRDMGGLGAMMHWNGPTMTDSGGFQVFSLGFAYGTSVSKIARAEDTTEEGAPIEHARERQGKLASVDEDGVTFRSYKDGSEHRFTPERSMDIQYNIGADMTFAFDECTSPTAGYAYQREAMERTHRWAERSLARFKMLQNGRGGRSPQALFGVVQGGRFEDLRKESANVIGGMDFDGYGIGGSFVKEDMDTAVGWVNALLPEEKPRHLLGIGEPLDLFIGAEQGADLFDCVGPTRIARTGMVYTERGRINLWNAQFVHDFGPIEKGCGCYTCKNYSRAYAAHLFRSHEMLGATLASIHNVYFLVNLMKRIRSSILDGTFAMFKKEFFETYTS
ncbi:MAG: tRNA guanosine(34) transglycosylase Tgt [Candidatus Yonathbacteria bacterium]|nr:tRNA guanosine(34) transglycosylase Tgt [Candidatus Yonathbacteria bacterium]